MPDPGWRSNFKLPALDFVEVYGGQGEGECECEGQGKGVSSSNGMPGVDRAELQIPARGHAPSGSNTDSCTPLTLLARDEAALRARLIGLGRSSTRRSCATTCRWPTHSPPP